MKKIVILFMVILSPVFLFGQFGSGTSSSPYWGTIGSSVTWDYEDFINGTVYVGSITPSRNKLTIGAAGQLTINSGVTVIFTQPETYLQVLGSILISGTVSNKVTLTKSGSNNNWGNIYFNNSQNSTIDHCIIEYAKGTTSIPDGGAISFDGVTSIVTIKNTIIRNCSINDAGNFGGGIEIIDSNPIIENCLIYDNYGAGIDIFGGSATITNCTIVNNNNPNTGESGGINISDGSPVVKNTILWNNTQGSTQEQDYLDVGGLATISYCATTQTISGTGMVDLHTTNNNATGPNFVNPSSDNYDITTISPCVDAGTTGGPSTDILNNTRVGAADIGAYENLEFLWQGDDGSDPTNWAVGNNWNKGIVPTVSYPVTIPDVNNDPVVNENPSTPALCAALTINSGGILTVAAGKALTVSGALTNNGKLILKSDANGIASLIVNSYTRGAGAEEDIELYLTGGGNETNYKWHYVSSPVASQSVSPFTAVTQDIAQFAEPLVRNNQLLDGWVASDGYVYSDPFGPLNTEYDFSSLNVGQGYNFFDIASSNLLHLGGSSLNTSNYSMSLSFSGYEGSGFNLLGNPFTSGLNWNTIIADPAYPSNTSTGLYFTRNNVMCYYIGGVGSPGDVNGYIPPMQGFFTKTYASGKSISLPAAARTHTAHARYKGDADIPLIRLNLMRNNTNHDETVIRFDDQAKSDFDLDFDAYKWPGTSSMTQIYSSLGGTKYAINGLPYPETIIDIPIVINVAKDTIHSISASELKGLEGYDVTLKDNNTGFTANLKTTPSVTFSSVTGTITGRFVLSISLATTGIENNPGLPKDQLNIYWGNNNINIQTVSDEWDGKSGSVKVMDLTGRVVSELRSMEFRRDNLIQLPTTARNGIYIVEIRSGLMRYTGKVVVR